MPFLMFLMSFMDLDDEKIKWTSESSRSPIDQSNGRLWRGMH